MKVPKFWLLEFENGTFLGVDKYQVPLGEAQVFRYRQVHGRMDTSIQEVIDLDGAVPVSTIEIGKRND